jgi:hypothetical protein
MLRTVLLSLVFAVISPVLPAAAMSSHQLLIPIAGRTPGALGSQWQTDLFVTNLSNEGTNVTIAFHPDNGPSLLKIAVLNAKATLVMRDFVKTEFGLDVASGNVLIHGSLNGGRLAARARIVNRGSAAGEFGQGIPGYPVDSLMREHLLTGLSTGPGERTNIGISNPWEVPVQVTLAVIESTGEQRGSFTTVVPPHGVLRYNDIADFATGEPLRDATVRVLAHHGVLAYASVVRNDSGDPTYIAGTGVATGNELLLPTSCPNPAPVALVPPGGTAAPGWIVFLRAGTDTAARTQQLAAKYALTDVRVFEGIRAFAAVFPAEVLRNVRCESDVTAIEQNAQVTP